MPRNPRHAIANGVYHVMNRGVERRDIVSDDRDRRNWFRLLDRVARRCGWRVFAWSLLDNHFHLYLRTPQPNLSTGMHDFESGYATLFNRRYGRSGVLFEGRFRSVVVEHEAHSLELTRYVHLNSARAGKVADPASDLWCSFRYYLNPRGAPDWLDWSTVLGEIGQTEAAARIAYRRFVLSGLDAALPDPLENAVDGWMLGSARFVERCRRHVADVTPAITLDAITEAVLTTFEVVPEMLRAAGRHHNVARDAAILLARELSPDNLDAVAARFAAGTRSAVTAAARRAAGRISKNAQFAELVNCARELLDKGSGVENSNLRRCGFCPE